MNIATIDLDEKFTRKSGPVFLTGMQALVRLALEQRRQDRARDLNTAGFISGYRGSPIGGFDRELWRAQKHLDELGIRFQPGVNEDIAATSIWGTQQVPLFPGARHDGVFGIWYGKGPGLDRSGDAIRHANQAGTSPLGGVLAVVGDDHSAKSSAFGAQSEYAFMDWMIPVVVPSNVSEFIDYGLFGFAMSRFSGLWTGFKLAGVSAESSASVILPETRAPFVLPEIAMPSGGLHIRYPEPDRAAYEARVKEFRLPAAIAFARANGIDRTLIDSSDARIGILTAGKAFGDVGQALSDLGLDVATAARCGIRLRKLGMTWPLDREAMLDFARGLDLIVVVEEKRGFVEDQLKTILFDAALPRPPRIVGKRDENGAPLFSDSRDLDALAVARVLVPRLAGPAVPGDLSGRLSGMEDRMTAAALPPVLMRTPYFCSGCPHNRSTVLPEGSLAIGGIGCHTLATRMDRSILTVTHMGGEGSSWIGISPFVEMDHVFQNVGDGTYFHSAQLGVRAAVAADVNMTFKILYNDAIAMTGGQPLDGTLTVPQLAHQVSAEGVRRIAVVADDPGKYAGQQSFPQGVTISHRDDLDVIQTELKSVKGVSVLIYDQTCAAEKRRRRKRAQYPDPAKRVFINEAVCEGCGDCGRKSNCLSVHPVETEFGTKRQIDQSSCNKDYSCVDGFCPSFVTVEGGDLRRRPARIPDGAPIPLPPQLELSDPHSILLAGIGGTGIVTVGALLGMAAHIEGKACTVNDVTGSAQKGGLVASHVILSQSRDRLHAERIQSGRADAMIAADLVVASMPEILGKVGAGTAYALVNTDPAQTGSFLRSADAKFPADKMRRQIEERLGGASPDFLAVSTVAKALTGDVAGANVLMLGIAWQKGFIPLRLESIEQAIRVNNVAVKANLAAFEWGRRIGIDRSVAIEAGGGETEAAEAGLDDILRRRADLLADYQDRRYADRYRALVEIARRAEDALGDKSGFAWAVAVNGYKLMAYKDEYEVARLLTSAAFAKEIAGRFEGDYRVRFHLAPPLLSRRDERTGHLKKRSFGSWMKVPMAVLTRFRFLRGTPLDIFGHTAERKAERALIVSYEQVVAELARGLTAANHGEAVAIAALPDLVRGYGHVKEANMARYEEQLRTRLEGFRTTVVDAGKVDSK